MTTPVVLSGKSRPRSLYIFGNPGEGKSSLIQRMALQDIRAGAGVCVIDPHGDLVNTLIHWIPESRIKDTVFFDADHPCAIDFFSYRDPADRQTLKDELLDVFRLEDAPISKPRLNRIIGTLFDANENGGNFTFLDILHFIEDSQRRKVILSHAPEYRTKQWPEDKFKRLSDYTSITERISSFEEAPTLKMLFDTPKPQPDEERKLVNIWDFMQNRGILLVSLKAMPTDYFIASFICAKIQQAMFARRYIDESQRIPFNLYVDECHEILKFAAPRFEAILTAARKYNLCLTMANQLIDDLPKEIRAKLAVIQTKIGFTGQFEATCSYNYGRNELPIKTLKYLGPSPRSFAREIIERTQRLYPCSSAESSQNRPGDNRTGGNPQVRQDKRDGIDYNDIPAEEASQEPHKPPVVKRQTRGRRGGSGSPLRDPS